MGSSDSSVETISPDPPSMASPGAGRSMPPVGVSPVDAGMPVDVGVPVRLRIPDAGVDASVTPLGLESDGSLAVPKDWEDVGWYERGPRPGQTGAAVLVGHFDSTTGPAVFYRLGELRPGDQVEVVGASSASAMFTIERAERVEKTAFPTDEVYGPVDRPELRLITCDGAFDRSTGHYVDNLVLYAYATAPS
jgi:hypothetical protein